MKRKCFLLSLLLVALSCVAAFAQRPRVSDPPKTNETTNKTSEQKDKNTTEDKDAQNKQNTTPPLESVKVKYEGGVMGYRQKMDGFLFFDNENSRLVFKDKQMKEIFHIPYEAVMSAFADTQSRRPTAATVIGSSVPYGLGLPALLIKKKYRYLTMQYNDTEVEAMGVTSFKIDSKELLEEALRTLADKAKLSPRGEVFVKKRKPSNTSSSSSPLMSSR